MLLRQVILGLSAGEDRNPRNDTHCETYREGAGTAVRSGVESVVSQRVYRRPAARFSIESRGIEPRETVGGTPANADGSGQEIAAPAPQRSGRVSRHRMAVEGSRRRTIRVAYAL